MRCGCPIEARARSSTAPPHVQEIDASGGMSIGGWSGTKALRIQATPFLGQSGVGRGRAHCYSILDSGPLPLLSPQSSGKAFSLPDPVCWFVLAVAELLSSALHRSVPSPLSPSAPSPPIALSPSLPKSKPGSILLCVLSCSRPWFLYCISVCPSSALYRLVVVPLLSPNRWFLNYLPLLLCC